ncbi:hypothetical protein P8C59_007252 [Phyllachora maydis]|uniref:Uncharacterized protein n=1 Tax=Phyllachora maydis TaxID=1825666 RepID=A0AAD9MDC9_9PEZI|nr:hypothetical protein P8C59_007252 [Phyllachora maydis]
MLRLPLVPGYLGRRHRCVADRSEREPELNEGGGFAQSKPDFFLSWLRHATYADCFPMGPTDEGVLLLLLDHFAIASNSRIPYFAEDEISQLELFKDLPGVAQDGGPGILFGNDISWKGSNGFCA